MTHLQTGFSGLPPRQPHGFVAEPRPQEPTAPPPDLALDGPPSGDRFIALLEAFRASGGTAPGDIVSRLLEEYRPGPAPSLAQLVHSGQVFGLEWRRSLWIPMFQFDPDDLSVAAGPQEVRAALPTLWSGWRVAHWFASPNPQLDGRRPVDALAEHLPAVVDAALARPMSGVVRPAV